MPKKRSSKPARPPKPKPRSPTGSARRVSAPAAPKRKTSPLLDTRVIFCGDNLDKLKDFPDATVDLIYIDPPFNSNRNYEVFWGETREKRSFEDRHASDVPPFYVPAVMRVRASTGSSACRAGGRGAAPTAGPASVAA